MQSVGSRTYPEWPAGFALERLVTEYLLGRSAGELDLSGRPAKGPASAQKPGQTEAAGTPQAENDSLGDGAHPAEAASYPDQHPPTGQPLVLVDLDALSPLALGEGLRVLATYSDEVSQGPASAGHAASPQAAQHSQTARRRHTAQSPQTAQSLQELHRIVAGTHATAVMKAPKAVAALRENLAALAGGCAEVIVVGRDKHVPRTIRAELQRYFHRVDISPGVAKSRLYIASAPVAAAQRPQDDFPASALRESKLPLVPAITVYAHGACFGGTAVDAGAWQLLAAVLENSDRFVPWESPNPAGEAAAGSACLVDLGCGNGWLLTAAALALKPGCAWGTDNSRAACASAAATLKQAGVDAQVTLSDAGADLESGSADLVLLNPPFHDAAAISVDAAHRMIEAAHRIAKPGAWVVMVFNSHLRYRSHVNHLFGSSVQVRRNAKFTVIAAQKPS